jgi:reverse gyrase
VGKILSGKVEERDLVRTALLVVESPNKARTIAGFFGQPSIRILPGGLRAYEVATGDYILTIAASGGHVYDLVEDPINEGDVPESMRPFVKRNVFGVLILESDGEKGYHPVYTSIKRCLVCGHQFTEDTERCPRCGSTLIKDSRDTVEDLRKLAWEADVVLIGTDPDTEGEKIGWDIALTLKPFNKNISRARFHEVTPQAIIEAIRSRGPFDKRLINAQIVRRVEDRWIGFALSSHLKNVYEKVWLGAGRVQTPVLGWIVNRYIEWNKNKGYLVLVKVEGGSRLKFFSEERVSVDDVKEVLVEDIETWDLTLKPLPPFTTDALLYEAQRRYGLPSWITMRLAQDLFETGLITYHRTDSTRVSPTGISIARTYLERTGKIHLYEGRPWSDEGAHEAIRPTRPLDVEELERAILEGAVKVPIKLTRLHFKLYDLIFRRFMASQMKPSIVTNVRARFRLGSLVAEVERPARVIEEGFTVIYNPGIEPWLLEMRKGQRLRVEEVKVLRASRVRLLTPGEAVKLMKEHGIGRPSTYSKAIEANVRHGYVVVSKKRGYLIPTKMGRTIYEYLTSNFAELVSVETTRRLEEELDKVERGELAPVEVLDRLWKELEKRNLVESVDKGIGVVVA